MTPEEARAVGALVWCIQAAAAWGALALPAVAALAWTTRPVRAPRHRAEGQPQTAAVVTARARVDR